MWFEDKVTADFAQKVKDIAARLDMVPDFMMCVMAFESGLNPAAKNPLSSATGLIQFMDATANAMGVSTALLAKMSAVQQLDYVERYFRDQISHYGKLQTLENTYLAVFYPAAITKPLDWQFPASVLAVNQVFNVDHNGVLTKQEVSDYLYSWARAKGYVVNKHITQVGIVSKVTAVASSVIAAVVAGWQYVAGFVSSKLT